MSWSQVQLGSIFEIARGGSPRPIDDYITDADDGLNWISIKDASNSSKYIYETRLRIKPAGLSKTRMVKPDDFILTNSMSFGRPYIMKTAGCIHDGWLVLSGDPERVDTDYFYHLFGSDLLKRRFSSLAAGAVVKNLNIDLVKGVEVPLPPLPEQKRIAAILDKADAIRRKRVQAIQLADDLLRAVFLDMFGDPVTNPKGWPRKALRTLGSSSTGKTPPSEKAGMWGKGTPFVTPGDLKGGIRSSAREVTEEGLANSRLCRAGGLLVCCIGATIGKVGISEFPVTFNQQINAQEWNCEVHDIYGYFVFKICPQLVRGGAIQTTLPILKKSLFDGIEIPVPPMDMQAKFAGIVERTLALSERGEVALEMPVFESLSQLAFAGGL